VLAARLMVQTVYESYLGWLSRMTGTRAIKV